MKTRNGFVSNSSSSSFIIAIARIADKEKFNRAFGDLLAADKGQGRLLVMKMSEITDEYGLPRKLGSKVVVEGFQSDVSIPIANLNDNDEIVAYSYYGDEGDGCFMRSEDDYECDYDIDSDFFGDKEQKVMEAFGDKDSGIDNVDLSYGAGRNG